MKDEFEKHRQIFEEETFDLLAKLELFLLDLEKNPGNTEVIDRVFRAIHTIKGSVAIFGMDEIAAFIHQVESVLGAVREGRLPVTTELADLMLVARDHIKSMIQAYLDKGTVDKSATRSLKAAFRRLSKQSGNQPAAAKSGAEEEQGEEQGEEIPDSRKARADEENSPAMMERRLEELQARQEHEADVSSIRVSSERLDWLVDLVGEVVTVQARLSQVVSRYKDPELLEVAEEVERLTAELRDNAMNIRMEPIGSLFSRFNRVVRDLSHELGKEVELVTGGNETELDKTVIERLHDPLIHLIRNSVDHGIELPHLRKALGKPPMGTVRISATHSGAFVLISISDDGAGMDAGLLKAKAVEKGLIAPDAELSEEEAFELTFLPDFSTALEVTGLSGRGVGLDVVKKNIDALRGSIQITSSRGKGTEITLKLPLTLAIIEGLMVRIGDDSFVLPLSVVVETVELTRDDLARAHGRQTVTVRDELIPYIRLRERFSISGARPEVEHVVLGEIDGKKIGFVVDHVVGNHQTVIKALGSLYKNVKDISGATLLGDGSIALILDVVELAQSAEVER